jgi:protein-disulfide isomerase
MGFAADMGLDTETFNACLDSGKYTQLIKNQSNIARQLGVSSTPTFVLNGQAIGWTGSFEDFQTKIDALLNP